MTRGTSWLCFYILLLAIFALSPAARRSFDDQLCIIFDHSGDAAQIANHINDSKRIRFDDIEQNGKYVAKDERAKRPNVRSPKGMVMVDGGSSGSKLFSFYPSCKQQVLKVLTECTFGIPDPCVGSHCKELAQQKAKYPLKGLSALGYKQDMCQSRVNLEGDHIFTKIQADRDIGIYADILLTSIKTNHEGHTCNSNKHPPINQMEVPILATAGMRLLPEAVQRKVWTSICGRQGIDGYAFAKGANCGTISGTDEAYYEFLAGNEARAHMKEESKEYTPAVTVTIGGESAQFAIPLEKYQLVYFAQLYDNVRRVVNPHGINCTNIHLPSQWKPDGTVTHVASGAAGSPIAKYNLEDCARDFVDIREMPPSLRDDQFQYVGLISMLGLQRLTGGIGVAGGMNSIEEWAKHNGCGAAEDDGNTADEHYDFAYFIRCKDKLEEALAGDALYSAVKSFFRHIPVWDVDVIFGTPSVIPSWRYTVSNRSIKDKIAKRERAGSDLQRAQAFNTLMGELEEQVKTKKNQRFGYNSEQTPMKTLYAYKYWQVLGLDDWQRKSSIWNVMKGAALAKRLSLHFEAVDWTKGKLAEMAEVASGKWPHARMDQSAFQEMIARGLEKENVIAANATVEKMIQDTAATELQRLYHNATQHGGTDSTLAETVFELPSWTQRLDIAELDKTYPQVELERLLRALQQADTNGNDMIDFEEFDEFQDIMEVMLSKWHVQRDDGDATLLRFVCINTQTGKRGRCADSIGVAINKFSACLNGEQHITEFYRDSEWMKTAHHRHDWKLNESLLATATPDVEMQELRQEARAFLVESFSNGKLGDTLLKMQTESDDRGPDLDKEKLRQQARAILVAAFSNGTLDTALSKMQTENNDPGSDVNKLRQQAQAKLSSSSSNGTLDRTLLKMKTENNDPGPDLDELRQQAREKILAAYSNGTLESALPKMKMKNNDLGLDVNKLRQQAQTKLLSASSNGTLDRALLKMKAESNDPGPDLEELRQQARAKFLAALSDGTLDTAVSKIKMKRNEPGSDVNKLRQQAQTKLLSASSNGTLDRAPLKIKTENNDPGPDLEDLRQQARAKILAASSNGTLDIGMSKMKTESNDTGDLEHLRQQAWATLLAASLNGSLGTALSKMRPESDDTGPDLEELRQEVNAMLVADSSHGALDAALSKMHSKRDDHGPDLDMDELRQEARAMLLAAASNGTLDAALSKIQTNRDAHGPDLDMDKLRQQVQAILVAAASNSTLDSAAKLLAAFSNGT